MDGYNRVEDEDGTEVFSTEDMYCTEDLDHNESNTIDDVVNMYNDGKSLEEIDEFLLDDGRCTQEDREIITEGIYAYLNPE